jgi:murein endopeptidase
MRAFVVAIGLLAFATTADAKPKKKKSTATATAKATGTQRRTTATHTRAKKTDKKKGKAKGKRTAVRAHQREQFFEPRGPVHGQSVGAPWAGRLRDATELPDADGYFRRRPWRMFGTKSMVEAIYHVIGRVHEQFPNTHEIAIGDLSAEQGGRISDHSSHQSGRDVDIGLIYTAKPSNYPQSFVAATKDNLDAEATFKLIEEFAATKRVQMMFLDYKVQGLLVEWARAHDVEEDKIDRLFQFTHGRGASDGMVRHEPNHMDHVHVRFKCPAGDNVCR